MPFDSNDDSSKAAQFTAQAEQQQAGFLAELVAFLRDNKRYWLAPILIVLLLVGVLMALATTSAAPLIYPLF